MSGEKENGFFGRWSRRKREAREETVAPAVAIDADAKIDRDLPVAPPSEEALDEKTLAERLAQLPRIEEIGELTDMRVFMQPWVPESIRGEALRKLWTVDRAVREHEIFADYALDYNTPGAAPGYGTLKTTAEMTARALGAFSRDPAAKVAAEPVSGNAPREGEVDSPAAEPLDSNAIAYDLLPEQRLACQPFSPSPRLQGEGSIRRAMQSIVAPANAGEEESKAPHPAASPPPSPRFTGRREGAGADRKPTCDSSAPEPEASDSTDEKSAASREAAVPTQPFASVRRRHGSAAPRWK